MKGFLITIAIVFGGLGIALAGKHIELIITKRWRKKNMKSKAITLSGLTELQCAKWFFLHERQRHVDDIVGIDADLEKLKFISLPTLVIELLGARFEIPEKFQ